MEFHPQKNCRVCLQTYSEMCMIFGEGEENGRMLRDCGKVEIEENDGLPEVICEYCLKEMLQAHNFVTKCQETDRKLRLSTAINVLKVKLEENHDSIKLLDDMAMIKIENDKDSCESDLNDIGNDSEPTGNEMDLYVRKKSRYNKKRRKSHEFPKKCSQCDVNVKCESAMVIHMRRHTNERPYQCVFCGVCYKTKGVLKVHMATHKDKAKDCFQNSKFECDYCKKLFLRKTYLIIHLRVHTGETPYSCKYCEKGFAQISNLIRHSKVHTGEKPFECNVCHKFFSSPSNVKKHSVVHSDERKFSCSICNMYFKTKSCLKSHVAVIHENKRRVVCDQCGVSFSTPGNLKGHIVKIHSKYSGRCDVCNKNFTNLKEHNRQHTGETPYQCNDCDRKFTTKNRLTSHIRKHANPDKFRCSYDKCNKTFHLKCMLTFHILKYHKKQTPYICKHCKRGFYRMSDLKRHLKLNHSDEPNILEDIKSVRIIKILDA